MEHPRARQLGLSEAFRQAGKDTGRWHWVFNGTIFRLDHRGTNGADRPVITDRGYVATRAGLESFRNQLYAEALLRGMAQAETVLILAEGAVWIWWPMSASPRPCSGLTCSTSSSICGASPQSCMARARRRPRRG